jgi:SAM-dependent methyltransferase
MRVAAVNPDPIAGAVPRSSPARALWRLKHRVRSLLGARRGFKVDGFYYKETSTELLARAVSRKGAGEKQYRVTCPDGSKLLIHCSLRRPYADIMGPVVLPNLQRAQAMVRPGMRVVTVPCGTGNAVRWLAERVGPSGAVVALDPDAESIAYAQRRYPRPNVAFEASGVSALAGEVDGSFDAGFVVSVDPDAVTRETLLEVWRVVAPGGWVLVGCPAEMPRAELDERLSPMLAPPGARGSGDAGAGLGSGGAGGEPAGRADWLSTHDDSFHSVLVRKLTRD